MSDAEPLASRCYVERNPVRAGLVERPDGWPWSSAAAGTARRVELAEWPLPRPDDWAAFVNAEQPQRDVDFIRARTASRRPISLVGGSLADLAVADPHPILSR